MQFNRTELQTRFKATRILVVGDVILDRYWFGDTHRISPEAPVPVTRIERTESRAGGAANVARNLSALGAQATLLSVVGDDEYAHDLCELLSKDHVTTHLFRDPSISTTVKLRVVARNQQLIRLDFETHPAHEILQRIVQQFDVLLPQCDVVVLSDYGKGGLVHVTDLIEKAREAGKPVLVDPKGNDYLRYRGATMVTPNRTELREVVGQWQTEEELAQKAEQLRHHLDFRALLLTRSEEGMSLYSENMVRHCPTAAREVYDVSGAGDTVIAAMALSIASGLPAEEAMQLANLAAGVVVAKVGTAVCSQEELFAHLD